MAVAYKTYTDRFGERSVWLKSKDDPALDNDVLYRKIKGVLYKRDYDGFPSARWWDMVGDDNMNCTPNFNRAVKDLGGRGTLMFYGPNYTFHSGITLDQTHVHIKGAGKELTNFKFTAGDVAFYTRFTQYGTINRFSDFTLRYRWHGNPKDLADGLYPTDYAGDSHGNIWGRPGDPVNPKDEEGAKYFHGHGFKMLSVTIIQDVDVYYASGHSFYAGGGLESHTLTEEFPAGSNSSMSMLTRCESVASRGSGFYWKGGDANQITNLHCSARDSGRIGKEDRSFLGTHSFGDHFNNNPGGHTVVSDPNARSSMHGCYGEGQPNAPVKMNSLSSWIGGINESGQEGGGETQGNKVRELDLGEIIIGNGFMQFRTSDSSSYHDFRNRSKRGQGTNFVMKYDNSDFEDGLMEMFAPQATTVNGHRLPKWAGYGFRNLMIGGKVNEVANNLEGLHRDFLYTRQDKVWNGNYDGTNALLWVCTQPGYVNDYTEGLTAKTEHGSGTVVLSGQTQVFRHGDPIVISGVKGRINRMENKDGKTILYTEMAMPAGNWPVNYQKCIWKGINI